MHQLYNFDILYHWGSDNSGRGTVSSATFCTSEAERGDANAKDELVIMDNLLLQDKCLVITYSLGQSPSGRLALQ